MIAVHSATPQCLTPRPPDSLRQVVSFPQGLPGFAQWRSFVLLAAESGTFQWLTTADGPGPSFLTVDPRRVLPTVEYSLTARDAERLEAAPGTALLWLAIVLVEPDGTVCANLRAPIVINPVSMIGAQIMPERSLLPVRHIMDSGA